MLYLLFQLGNDRYALESSRVVEILPLVEIRKLPQAPHRIAGVFNYHGQFVPAVDLSDLILKKPAAEKLSTRIVLIKFLDDENKDHLLGLIAEHATTIIRRDPVEFKKAGVNLQSAPFLGSFLADGNQSVQLIDEQKLLSENARDFVCKESMAAATSE